MHVSLTCNHDPNNLHIPYALHCYYWHPGSHDIRGHQYSMKCLQNMWCTQMNAGPEELALILVMKDGRDGKLADGCD